MNGRFSRRALLFGVGGSAVSAAAVWKLVGFGGRSRSTGEEAPSFEDPGSFAEHDGWLVTPPDKRLLEFPVRYLEGWHPPEGTSGTTWRWSGKAGTIRAPNLGVEATIFIDYDGRADLFRERPRTITVSVDGRVLETFVADALGRQRRGVPLPAGAGPGEVLQLTLATDRTFVPAERVSGSEDRRELGLRVYGVEIRERGLAP